IGDASLPQTRSRLMAACRSQKLIIRPQFDFSHFSPKKPSAIDWRSNFPCRTKHLATSKRNFVLFGNKASRSRELTSLRQNFLCAVFSRSSREDAWKLNQGECPNESPELVCDCERARGHGDARPASQR